MKYELTKQQLEEMVLCIVHNHLDENEAMEYALSVCGEFTSEDAELVDWPDDRRISAIGQNGNDGLHYEVTA
ncbi:MAG: hypothetical protein WA981_00815 [Glaciecola sp.]